MEVLFSTEPEARRYALERSRDFPVLSASVTRYRLGELGTRTPVCWYESGTERHPRERRPGRIYPSACGPG